MKPRAPSSDEKVSPERMQRLLQYDLDWPTDRYIKVVGPRANRVNGNLTLYYRFMDSGLPTYVDILPDNLRQWFHDTGFDAIRHYHNHVNSVTGKIETQRLLLYEFPNSFECSLFKMHFGIQ